MKTVSYMPDIKLEFALLCIFCVVTIIRNAYRCDWCFFYGSLAAADVL